jgi:PAS domain S-box-containing protein
MRMFGYTKREIVGKSLSVIVPEPMGSQHDAYMRAYIETGKEVRLHARCGRAVRVVVMWVAMCMHSEC